MLHHMNACLKTRLWTPKSFTCVAEVLPPKSCFISDREYETLDRAVLNGAHAFSVASNPMGTIRMEASCMAQMIQSRFSYRHYNDNDDNDTHGQSEKRNGNTIPCIVHLTCRGRSLLQHQSHLLSLYHFGLRNVLVVTGDLPRFCPGASEAFDLDSIQFIQLLKRNLANGVNSCGQSMGQAMDFTVGCAANMQVTQERDLDWQLNRLHAKVMSDVDFVMTQPIFDLATIAKFLHLYEQRFGALRIPILTGILPIRSMSHIKSLEKIPGLLDLNSFRFDFFKKLSTYQTLDDHRFSEKSYDDTVELVRQLQSNIHPMIRGIYVTAGPSLQSNGLALRLIREFSNLT